MSSEPGLRLVHSDKSPTVDELLGRVARGDELAFAALYDALSARVYGLARRVVLDPSRSEDVAQEVFLEVWRKATRLDPSKGGAKTWILTIAHRRAVDAVRRGESQKRQDHHGAPEDVSQDGPEDALIEAEEHVAVRGCLETLTDRQPGGGGAVRGAPRVVPGLPRGVARAASGGGAAGSRRCCSAANGAEVSRHGRCQATAADAPRAFRSSSRPRGMRPRHSRSCFPGSWLRPQPRWWCSSQPVSGTTS